MPFSPWKYASSKQIRASLLLLLLRKGNKWKSFGGIGEKKKKKPPKQMPLERLVDKTMISMKEQNEKQEGVNQQGPGPSALLLEQYRAMQAARLKPIFTGWHVSSLYIWLVFTASFLITLTAETWVTCSSYSLEMSQCVGRVEAGPSSCMLWGRSLSLLLGSKMSFFVVVMVFSQLCE